MKSRFHLLAGMFICLCLAACLSPAVFADTESSKDLTQFGHDISIKPGEQVGDVTCIGCSVRVRGHVATDVTVFGGSLVIEDQGQVEGDATVFGGGIRLDKSVKVGGDVTVFGGEVRRDPAATVGGDVTNFSGTIWIFLIFALPIVFLGGLIALIVWLVMRLQRPAAPQTA